MIKFLEDVGKGLRLESPVDVFKSFNVNETSANFYEVCSPAMRPKNPDAQPRALDKEIHNTFQ